MFLDYFALFLLSAGLIVLFYVIIYIHDIPYELAKKRGHPHQDAIHVGGWVSLFTLHAIWPFLWIWAMMHKPGQADIRVAGLSGKPADDSAIQELRQQISELQERLSRVEDSPASQNSPNTANPSKKA